MNGEIITLEESILIHGRVLWYTYRENGPWLARQRAEECDRGNDLEGAKIWRLVELAVISLQEQNAKTDSIEINLKNRKLRKDRVVKRLKPK